MNRTMNQTTAMKLDELGHAADAAVNVAKKAGALSDRSWLAILVAFGLLALSVVFHWHREDQRAMMHLFSTTLKQNSEALTRAALALERVERVLPSGDRR